MSQAGNILTQRGRFAEKVDEEEIARVDTSRKFLSFSEMDDFLKKRFEKNRQHS
jgi:hypothetical protein